MPKSVTFALQFADEFRGVTKNSCKMAVKIRLARRGRKKLALFDIVVADARAPRDGRFIEKIGTYNPNTNPASINLNTERAFHWMMVGAQPTDTTKAILTYKGIMHHRHLQIGVLKGALTQEQADAKMTEWTERHEGRIASKVDTLATRKADDFKKRLEAESKVKEARAAAIAAKNVVVEEVEAVAETEEAPVDAPVEIATEAPATEETTEAPAAE
jgi:small subunit ribosomal protein S16